MTQNARSSAPAVGARASLLARVPGAIVFRIRRTRRQLVDRRTAAADARALHERLPWLGSATLAPHRDALEPWYRDYMTVSTKEMAISLRSAAFLSALCEHQRPRRIIDLGSGFSSAVIRRYAMEAGAEVLSVDDSPEWLDATATFLGDHGLSDAGLITWSELLTDRPEPADLVFHDLGPMALRAEALDDVARLTAPHGLTIFDDMHHYGDLVRARAASLGYEAVLSARRYTRDLAIRYQAVGFKGAS